MQRMFIWRGWGILPVLYTVVAFVLVMSLESAQTSPSNLPFAMETRLLIAGIATRFTGMDVNRSVPGELGR